MRRLLCAVTFAALAVAAGPSLALDAELRKQAKDPDPARRCDAARALAKEGSADAARLLAELFADEAPLVRDAAVLACAEIRDADAVRALAAAAKSRDDLTRRNCADALGRTGCSAALPALESLAHDASPLVRCDALDALGRFLGEPKAASAAHAAADDRDPFVRAAAVEAVARIGCDGAADIAAKALADSDEGVRCVARAALRLVARERAVTGLATAAADPSWRIRAQCVDDAAALREPRAMDVLVALVGDRSLRVAAAARRALVGLTGKEIGRDADLWAAWWDANRAAWKPPEGDPAAAPPDDPKRTTANYHGIAVETAAAAFVVDLSGSMKEPFGGAEKGTRWSVAAEELNRTLASLPDDFVTDLVFFQQEIHRAFGRPQALTNAARAKAAAFVSGGSPAQTGDLLGGVLAAIGDDAVDTVFVLSDGAPSSGDFVEASRVRSAVRQRNRLRKCAIDTVGFGAHRAVERAFLAGLARDSGGSAVFRAEGSR